MSVAELAFLVLIVAKMFGKLESIDWWMVFIPLILCFVYDIVELIIKMHNKAKEK